ncbi:MAG: ion channel [Isosphaeraceae bacterium]
MILPLMVATVLLFSTLLVYGTAMQLIVRVVVRLIRSGSSALGFWKSTAVMAIVTAITAAAHLAQIALWAVLFLLCGQVSTLETAFYLSAQNCTALGYGDVLLSERWRLLGHLEAINGLLFFGLSTAVLFAIMSQLIAKHLQTETGYQSEAAGNQAPRPVAGDAWSRDV